MTSRSPSSSSMSAFAGVRRFDEPLIDRALQDRQGSVLSAATLLKPDYRLPMAGERAFLLGALSGCPVFRKAFADDVIYALGQPTETGVRCALNFLQSTVPERQRRRLLWINLREEPVVYVNRKPMVVREELSAFSNQAFSRMSVKVLEQLEERLRDEIVEQAAHTSGLFLIHREFAAQTLVPTWELATADTVTTSVGLHRTLLTTAAAAADGANSILYSRVPMPSELALLPSQLDKIMKKVLSTASDQVLVFHDQSGATRVTLAVVLARLVRLHRTRTDLELLRFAEIDVPEALDASRTNFPPVQTLTTLVPYGPLAKKLLDYVVDEAATTLHLRRVILERYEASVAAASRDETVRLLAVAKKSLQRYLLLLAFSAYLFSLRKIFDQRQSLHVSRPVLPDAPFCTSDAMTLPSVDQLFDKEQPQHFSAWLESHREVRSLLAQELRSEHFVVPSSLARDGTAWLHASDSLIHRRHHHDNRSGALLSKGKILFLERSQRLVRGPLALRRSLADDGEPALPRSQPLCNGLWTATGLPMPAPQVISAVCNDAMARQPRPTTMLWINLREDPIIFINGVAFALRSADQPLQHLDIYRGIDPQAVEELERQLKADIVKESVDNQGRVLLHRESEGGQIESWFELLTGTAQVQTQSEAFAAAFAASAAAAAAQCLYLRIPLTSEEAPEFQDFEQLVDALRRLPVDSPCELLPFSLFGVDRATTMLVCIAIYCLRRSTAATAAACAGLNSPLRSATSSSSSVSSTTTTTTTTTRSSERQFLQSTQILEREFLIVLDLLRTIPCAARVKYEVDAIIDQFSAAVHLKLVIFDTLQELDTVPKDSADIVRSRLLRYLKRYVLLLLFNAYLSDDEAAGAGTAFSAWMASHPEYVMIVEHIDKRPEHAIRLSNWGARGKDESHLHSLLLKRSGNVLNSGSILKADHFPGAQRPGFEPIDGVPNFRLVPGHPIAGFAIPTITGTANVLSRLGAQPGGAVTVAWSSLREEPVLYINNQPYVVRNVGNPYENLSYTGISAVDVENLEQRLKQDVLRELNASAPDSCLLLHGEAMDPLSKKFVLHGDFVPTLPENVLTPREVFESLVRQGWRVQYARLPITDEQHPEEKDFDELLAVCRPLLTAEGRRDYVTTFHCQMGRGRTTTGMIVATLIAESHLPVDAAGDNDATPQPPQRADAEQSTAALLQGNYLLITRLTRLIPDGKHVKRRVDRVIDQCSRMQNLREDIFPSFSKATDTALPKEERSHAKHVAKAYLIRYAYLIIFAAFLEHNRAAGLPIADQSFESWVVAHPELTAPLEKFSLL